MKAMIIGLVLSVLLTAGFTCSRGIPTEEVTYPNQSRVIKLFTHEGCAVYKFYDESGNRAYFTNCKGSSKWDESHRRGKTSVTEYYSTEGGK